MLMEDAIWLLPPADREAIVLRFYQGENFARIGDSFNLSAEAVRKRISRALATVRTSMLRDGIDAIPDELLGALATMRTIGKRRAQSIDDNNRIHSIAKGTMTMMTQMEAIDFAAMSAEFFVKDVEANLDFFEKLGFRRHYMEAPDAMGRMPRASLRGGTSARIWLRRAAERRRHASVAGRQPVLLDQRRSRSTDRPSQRDRRAKASRSVRSPTTSACAISP